MKRINIKSQAARINEFNKGYIATHLINIGNELGIFEALKNTKKGLIIPDIAAKLGLYEPYLKIWCQTAYFFEILDCDSEGRFKFQPFLDKILGDKSNFRNVLASFNLNVNVIGERLKISPEYYKTGGIIEGYSPKRSELVAEVTKPMNIFLKNYFTQLPNDDPIKQMLEQGIKFLDIGYGAGRFIIQLAQISQNSRFVGIDPVNHGIKMAKKTLLELGLEGRVSVECLGGEEIPYNDEFYIISMVVTLHDILSDVRFNILEKAYQALKSNGRLLIFDLSFPDKIEDFRNPNYELGIIDQFVETCLGVKHLNAQEQNEMLTNAGFKDIQRTMFEGIDIVTALKQ